MKNILIVEDEIELAQNIQDLLEHLGFRVIGIFDNAKEVLGYLKTQKPDLILMDIQIKGDMDGIELCQQVKLKYDVPVVYLTAFSDISYLDRIAANKYEGYLLKP
ncbi:MAG: response regulator, partial [Cyclobacteriaceae bacterium]|nr:response regulator [Cyclobacteriaceae bacterium]